MPDDQYVLFIPDKDCLDPDPNEAGKRIVSPTKMGTNNRAIEQWANRTPYLVSYSSAFGSGYPGAGWQRGTTGTLADLNPPTMTRDFDPMLSWDSTNSIFTSKVNAMFDLILYVTVPAFAVNSLTILSLFTKKVRDAAYAQRQLPFYKHVHDTTDIYLSTDHSLFAYWLSEQFEIEEKAKFKIVCEKSGAAADADFHVNKLCIRRVTSIAGSTQ